MGDPTFTIFSDANSPGWAEGFAELLREASSVEVEIADSLDSAIEGDSDVLILNLGRRDDEKLSPERIATLARRRIVGMAPGADWLCDQLDELEVHGGMIAQANLPMLLVDSDLLGDRSTNEPIKPFAKHSKERRIRRHGPPSSTMARRHRRVPAKRGLHPGG